MFPVTIYLNAKELLEMLRMSQSFVMDAFLRYCEESLIEKEGLFAITARTYRPVSFEIKREGFPKVYCWI
jgi:hypothetical protein